MILENERPPAGFAFSGFLLVALSLSIGWGIRGNFGHEYGAMMPGALAAIAIAIASGREDWMRRTPWFAFLGGVGWSFGGSQSYMQVISYTHSGHNESVAYGYACLTLMGFLWACFGGAFTAFAAVLDRRRLNSLAVMALVVFGAWLVQDLLVSLRNPPKGMSRHEDPLYWFDTDWLGASTALAAAGVYALVRRRIEFGASLVLHMAAGWLAGFLLLVVGIGFRMTPPRGDNWAGCLGMFLGLMVFLVRRREAGVAWVTFVTGTLGGVAFSLATLLKLTGMTSGLNTNWHSVLEQTYGFLNGLAIAIPMSAIARRQPPASEEGSEEQRWTTVFAVWFSLCALTYVNLIKNVPEWIKVKVIPAQMAGISSWVWYTIFYAMLSIVVIVLGLRHQRRPLAFVPSRPLGRSQFLFFVLLWWVVIGNFEREVLSFVTQRLITEGVITLNALICTLLAGLMDRPVGRPQLVEGHPPALSARFLSTTSLVVILVAGLNILGDWQATRAMYGENVALRSAKHIRFGPDATVKPAPVRGMAHP